MNTEENNYLIDLKITVFFIYFMVVTYMKLYSKLHFFIKIDVAREIPTLTGKVAWSQKGRKLIS